MIKVYIVKLIPGARPFPILNRHLGILPYTGTKPYRAIFDEMDFRFIEIIDKPNEADFLMLPHNYFYVKKDSQYPIRIKVLIAYAEKYNKKILVFAFGDSDEKIEIPHAVFFRCFGY